MLIVPSIVAALAAGRALQGLRRTLRGLPRSNRDWIFF